jgi:hypothetical protein
VVLLSTRIEGVGSSGIGCGGRVRPLGLLRLFLFAAGWTTSTRNGRDAGRLGRRCHEQPPEKARVACTDHDQPGLTLLGGVDELLRWLTGDAGEFDVQVRIGERVGRVRREARLGFPG